MRTAGTPRRTARAGRNRRRAPRNRRRFNLRRLVWPLLLLMALSAVGAGCYLLLTAPALSVTRVKVVGARLVDPRLIEADARSVIGRNILTVSKKRLAAQTMRPEIRSVTIGRSLPRTVVVRVAERVPYLTVTDGRRFWLADRSGLPFHEVRSPADGIPLVALPTGVDVEPGRPIRHPSIRSAIGCIEECRVFRYKVSKISVDRAGNLCLNIGSKFYVKLGQPVAIPKKLAALSRMLSAKPEIGERALYIDVSCDDRPAVQLRSSEDGEPSVNT